MPAAPVECPVGATNLIDFERRAKDYAGMTLLDRITVDTSQCGARPCLRGTRIRVADILSMLSEGVTWKEILFDFPYLEVDDIKTALTYAARETDHAHVRGVS